uniref:Uncharacterized protein n=1 Tax=Moniliophthora roreri TaxID=221103 RepID=A0A0W0FFI2_MONRR
MSFRFGKVELTPHSETQTLKSLRRRRSTSTTWPNFDDDDTPTLGDDKVSVTSESPQNLMESIQIEILDSRCLRTILELLDGLDMLYSLGSAWVPGIIELLRSEAQAQTSMNDNDYRNLCMKCLRVLVLKHQLLPQSLFLNDVTRHGTHPLRGGGFADIYKGYAHDKPVCLKVLRVYVHQ